MNIVKCTSCGRKFTSFNFFASTCPDCNDNIGMPHSPFEQMLSVCPVCRADKASTHFVRCEKWDEEEYNQNNKVHKFLKRHGNKHALKAGNKICEDCWNKIKSLYYDW